MNSVNFIPTQVLSDIGQSMSTDSSIFLKNLQREFAADKSSIATEPKNSNVSFSTVRPTMPELFDKLMTMLNRKRSAVIPVNILIMFLIFQYCSSPARFSGHFFLQVWENLTSRWQKHGDLKQELLYWQHSMWLKLARILTCSRMKFRLYLGELTSIHVNLNPNFDFDE